MRKGIGLFLTVLFCGLVCLLHAVPAFAKQVTLQLDGASITTDVPPQIIDDRTMIPARALFEKLGASVSWNDAKKQVTIDYGETVIVLTVQDKNAKINGVTKAMDVPATIVNSRTLIPVRFVAENLGFAVDWDAENYIVRLTSPVPERPAETDTPAYTYSHYLTAASVQKDTDYAVITVRGVGKASVSTMTLKNPTRYVFDFKDTRMAADETEIVCSASLLARVRLGQFDTKTARVVLDLDAETGYTVDGKASGSDYVITVSYKNAVLPSKPTTPVTNDSFLVFIDPGHGGSEVGTVGKLEISAATDTQAAVVKTIYEKEINLKIAKRVNALLEANGVQTYMLRTTDEYINIYERPKIANAKQADLYLSIHNNASTSTTVHGTQIYYSDSCPQFSGLTNKEMANIYYDAITNATGLRRAGVVDNNRYIVINQTEMPSLIVEVAFMSNQEDLTKLLQDAFVEKVANGICNATLQVLKKVQ